MHTGWCSLIISWVSHVPVRSRSLDYLWTWLNRSCNNRQFYPQILSHLKKEKKKSFPQVPGLLSRQHKAGFGSQLIINFFMGYMAITNKTKHKPKSDCQCPIIRKIRHRRWERRKCFFPPTVTVPISSTESVSRKSDSPACPEGISSLLWLPQNTASPLPVTSSTSLSATEKQAFTLPHFQ